MVRVALAAPDPYPGKVAAISDVQKTQEQKNTNNYSNKYSGQKFMHPAKKGESACGAGPQIYVCSCAVTRGERKSLQASPDPNPLAWRAGRGFVFCGDSVPIF